MTLLQAVVSILVALIAGTTGGGLVFAKFWIERKDKKEENAVQKQIDDSIKLARKEITEEIKAAVQQGIVDCGVIGDRAIREMQEEFVKKLDEGLKARGEEGKERFEINSKQIEENSLQLSKNAKQIEELTSLTKDVLETMDSLGKVVSVSAESQRNSNYDRLLIVTNKILKSSKMTISDKTNLKQLYKSWKDLNGEDPKMDTMYEECMKFTPVPDED